jgi:hypothetical protein
MIVNAKTIENQLLLRRIWLRGSEEAFNEGGVLNASEESGHKRWHKRRLRRLLSTNYIGRVVDRVVDLF